MLNFPRAPIWNSPKRLVPAGLHPLPPSCRPSPGNDAVTAAKFYFTASGCFRIANLFPFFASWIFYLVIKCKIQEVNEKMLICTSQLFLFLQLSELFSGLLFSFFSPPFFSLFFSSFFFFLFSSLLFFPPCFSFSLSFSFSSRCWLGNSQLQAVMSL